MAVINLRLKELFLFLRLHGTGNVLVHDSRGLQLAGVIAAAIVMVTTGVSVGTAVSWLL